MKFPLRSAIVAIALISAPVTSSACQNDQATLRGDWGTARFSIEVVDTALTRGKGLMHRTEMATSSGMLFVYRRPGSVSFWMKNTLIPLDMIFFDKTGTVGHVHSNAIPGDLTAIPGGDDVLMVLEINGGLATRMGIAEGSVLQHPALDQTTAAFPCEKP